MTKYDPAYRDELGRYTKNEWTEFCDIGHSFDGHVLTTEGYLRVEDAYVEAMRLLSERVGAEEFETKNWGIIPEQIVEPFRFGGFSSNIPCIGLGEPVRLENLADVGRLLLRGGFWCILKHPHLEFHFGYDYYMRVWSDLDLGDAFRCIEQKGLFVEPLDRACFEDLFEDDEGATVRDVSRKSALCGENQPAKMRYWLVDLRLRSRGGVRIDFSNVGKPSGRSSLSPRRYLRAEKLFVRALRFVSVATKADEFMLSGLRLTPDRLAEAVMFGGLSKEPSILHSKYPLGLSGLSDVVRLIMRGGIWCVLKHPHLEVHIPESSYMIIGTDLEFGRVLRRIERMGFSVEPTERPTYEWEKDERTSKTGEF